MKKNKRKNDILLILVLLVVAGGIWLITLLTRVPGAYVDVSIDGETVMTLPLSEDTSIEFGEGEHTNRLIIESGEAFVTEASCPDHLCIKQGKASHNGETIVCLPNKFVVTVVGGENSEVDFVSK